MNGATVWAEAMRALSLFAIDPAGLGGIAVRAGAGPVRDRFLTLLHHALPPGMPVRRLPVHIGDDRLLGGLDLAATLRAGRPIAQKGALAEADGGVVVLAMAERMEPGGAARLLAVVDDGAVTLQRDGLSSVLSTQFGIVALDEGIDADERPPASLLDRLAFHVDLTGVSIRDMEAGVAGFSDADTCGAVFPELSCRAPFGRAPFGRAPSGRAPFAPDLVDGVDEARVAGESSVCDGVSAVCNVAMALGIDSLRAPLLALRAARVVAGLCGRDDVSDADLGVAARLVLAPRATRFPAAEDGGAPSDVGEAGAPSDAGEAGAPSGAGEAGAPSDAGAPSQSEDASVDQDGPPDQKLADTVLEAAKAALPSDLLAGLALMDSGRGLARISGRAGQFKAATKRGRPIGIRPGEPKGGARLHLLETLKAAAPWQELRRQATDHPATDHQATDPRATDHRVTDHQAMDPRATDLGRLLVRRDDFRIVRFRQRIGTTTVFAVDASGSAAMHRLSEAKGAVELLLADCYVRRDQVALLAFRGLGATCLLPPTGSLLRAKRSLAGLPGGGPTPLAAGIEAALSLANTIRRAGRTPVITLLTDARANVARDGTGGRKQAEAEAMETARSIRASGVATLLVDTSPRPNPFASRLAEEMRARYVPLPYADASALSRAVRSTVAA